MRKITTGLFIVIIILVFEGVFSLGICKSTEILLAHSFSSEHSYHIAAQKFKEIVEKNSNNEIKVKIFPQGQLGSVNEILNQIAMGSIGAAIIPVTRLSSIFPGASVLGFPMAVNDIATVVRYLSRFESEFLKKSVRVISALSDGLVHVASNLNNSSISDLNNITIGISKRPYLAEFFLDLGARVKGLPYNEIEGAYNSKVINAFQTSLNSIHSLDQVKSIILTGHLLRAAAIVMSKKQFERLAPTHQEIINEAARHSSKLNFINRIKYDEERKKELNRLGINFVNIDRSELRKKAKPVFDKFKEENPEKKDFLEKAVGDSCNPCKTDECKCDDKKCHKKTDQCCVDKASQIIGKK